MLSWGTLISRFAVRTILQMKRYRRTRKPIFSARRTSWIWTEPLPTITRAFLGRRSQRRQASGAKGVSRNTFERREHSIL